MVATDVENPAAGQHKVYQADRNQYAPSFNRIVDDAGHGVNGAERDGVHRTSGQVHSL